MPTIICGCGATHTFSDGQARSKAGKPFKCHACGATRLLPLWPEIKPISIVPAEHARATDTKAGSVSRGSLLRFWILASALICLAIGTAAWIILPKGWARRIRFTEQVAKRIDDRRANDGARVAVHFWLKENLNDPEFDEVRWWPPREMIELKERTVAEWRQLVSDQEQRIKESEDAVKAIEDDPERILELHSAQQQLEARAFGFDDARATLQKLEREPPEKVCRLKYRTKLFGGKILQDRFFLIGDSGKAVPVDIARSDEYREFIAD